ncbi:MAG: OmpA family protein [Oligoflexia bacterium]|nr:OmpA family protein [Oligoflexia bacterium]
MMKSKKMLFIKFMFCLSFLFITSTLYAEYPMGAFNLSPFFGGYKFDGAQNYRTRPIYGLRLGKDITENSTLELVGGYIRTRAEEGDNVEEHKNIFRYSLDGLYKMGVKNSVVPYLALGIGGMTFKNPSFIPDRSVWQANYGLGLMAFVADRVALRGDIRHLVLLNTDHYSNFEGSIGLTFLFGGNSQATETPKEAKEEAPPTPTAPPVKQPSQDKNMEAANIVLKDVYFEFDSAELTKEGTDMLDKNIQIIKENPDIKVRIEGHSSASGSIEHNQELSERRAENVKNYMVNTGNIDSERLTTIGFGKTKPVVIEPYPEDILSNEARANMCTRFMILQ